ncbi:unnamed protein product [Mytilus coruscus]|uniref:Uncharacterized protein n=1 Tax=Mytilus coruscus TaxID=42192 RepID=A0A6J8EK31_MYTCO|nr:unnamed protein product [Mytilus coruscus]
MLEDVNRDYKNTINLLRSQLEIKNTTLTNNEQEQCLCRKQQANKESYIEEKLEGMLEKFKIKAHQSEIVLIMNKIKPLLAKKNQQIEHHCESLGTQRTSNERDILKNNSEPTSYIQNRTCIEDQEAVRRAQGAQMYMNAPTRYHGAPPPYKNGTKPC